MSFITYPNFSGGSGSGGGAATVTYPLNGPAGSASAATFSVGGMGGLFSPSGGGVGLTSNGVAGLTLDSSGNVNLSQQLAVAGSASFAALTASGALSGASLGISGSASISQGLSASTLAASGGITGQSLNVQAGISAATLTLSGNAQMANLSVSGTLTSQNLASTGNIYFPISAANQPGLAGNDSHRNTGVFADTSGGLGFATAGLAALTINSSQAVTVVNALTAAQLATPSLQATSATVSQNVSVGGALAVTKDITGSANLNIAGTANLATLAINTLSTQSNVSIGGTLGVTGGTTLSTATITSTLSVAGQTTLAGLSASLGNFTSFQIEGTADQGQSPVATSGQRRFTATLGNNGDLALSGRLAAGNSVSFSKDLTASSISSGSTISAQGAVSASSFTGQTLILAGKHVSAGQGSPSGSVTGSTGDEYTDLAAGLLYIKISGANTNTGWAAVTTAATGVSYPALAPDSAASAPSYAFSAATNYGLGHSSSGLYLATAGTPALTLDASQNATFAAGLSAQGPTNVQALTAAGATNLRALTAQNTSVQALTATSGGFSSTVTAAALSVSGASSLSSASLSGSLAAAGSVTGATLFSGSTPFLAGAGSPQGQVAAPVGAFYTDTSGGGAWYKMSATDTSGWVLFESGAPPAVAPAYPLAAPESSTPQYAFQGGATDGMGSVSSGTLYFKTGGATAISVNSSQAVTLANALAVAGALTASSSLAVAGPASLAAASLTGALSVQGLATFSGGVSIPASLSVGQTVSAGSSVKSGGAAWTSGSGAPTASANDGDFYTDTKAGDAASLYVHTNGAWKAVALSGASAPSQFPLLAPADSASAPSYSWAAGTGTYGLYSPGNNQVAISTSSAVALSIDASQNVTLAAALSGHAGTFTQLTSSGGLSVANNGSFGGTLGVTGAVTLSSTLASGAIQSSGAISGASGSFNGALSSGSLAVTNNASIGGNLVVSGTTTLNGVQQAPYYESGDGSKTSPGYAFTSEPGLGWFRPTSATLAAAAAGNIIATLSASSAAFAGAGSFAGGVTATLFDAPIVRSSGGTLTLQAGTTTILTLASGAASATVPVVVPAGSSSAPGLQVGTGAGLYSANDTRPAFPVSVTLLNPRGAALSLSTVPDTNTNSNYFIFGAAGGGLVTGAYAPNGYATGTPGQLYQYTGGGSGTSLYVYEGTSSGATGWVAVRTASQTVTPSFPIVGPAGSAAAPTYAVGSATSGLYSGTDANSRAFVGLSQGGAAVARLAAFSNNSTAVYVLGLGDPTSTSVSGGLVASSQAPSTGAPAAFPGMLYQDTRGGAAQSLWVNESTTSTPAFAKVLTTSSPAPQPTFPLLGPADSVSAPDYSWSGNTGSGLYLAGANSVGFATAGVKAGTISSAQAWTFFGALTANTTLSVVGAASLASTLAVTGGTTLQAALSGTSASFSGNGSFGGTLSVTGLFTGTSATWSTSSTSPLFSITEGTAPSTASTGQVFVKSSDHNLYFLSSTGTTTQLSPASTAFPLLAPADSVSAPDYSWSGNASTGMYLAGTNSIGFTTAGIKSATISSAQAWTFAAAVTASTTLSVTGATSLASTLAVTGATTLQSALSAASASFSAAVSASGLITANGGVLASSGSSATPGLAIGSANTGVFTGSDQSSIPFLGVAQGGVPVSYSWRTTANSNTFYAINIGDPASTSLQGGIKAGTVTPLGNTGTYGGQIYQWLNGGPGQSLWVHEGTGTGNSSAWAKVLTTSSAITPTFPLQSTTLGTTSAPAYGFATSGYTTTGINAAPDAGSSNIPCLTFVAGGVAVGFVDSQTVNSTPVYNLTLGSPNVTASPYNARIQGTAQAASGNLGSVVGGVAINTAGAAGTVLAVKESGTSTSGWSFVYTQGTAQLAGQSGSVAAPYHSFSNSLSSGFSYNSTNGTLITSVAGTAVLTQGTAGAIFGNSSYVQVPGGTYQQPSLCFTGSTTTGLYLGSAFSNAGIAMTLAGASTMALVKYSGTNSGIGWAVGPNCVFDTGGIIWSPNMPTGTATTSPGTLFLSTAGGSGTTAWIKESGSQTTSGYAALLTTTSSQASVRLVQGAAPSAVSGQTLLYGDTSNRLAFVTSASSAAGVSTYVQPDIAATVVSASATMTAAQSGITFVASGSTQYTLTLPATTTYDIVLSFQIEGTGGFKIQAPTNVTVYNGTSASSSGGSQTSNSLGSFITLYNRAGSSLWIARATTGSWTAA